MINLEHRVVIDRSVEDVFAYVADQTNEPKWHTDVLEVRPEGRVELGSTVTWLVKFMGESQYVNEVTAFEPQRRIEFTARRVRSSPLSLIPSNDPTGRRDIRVASKSHSKASSAWWDRS
jgi:uncharacterized protein YndB with AHSA1/START domain